MLTSSIVLSIICISIRIKVALGIGVIESNCLMYALEIIGQVVFRYESRE